MISAKAALENLQAGNRRFVAGQGGKPIAGAALPPVQEPSAVILGCSDARVPVEIVFDQAPGELFVVRVAGNVAGPLQAGSIEFAAGSLGTRLIVVLGHSGCGAVMAALRAAEDPGMALPANLRALVDTIKPAIAGLHGEPDRTEALVEQAVRVNVANSIRQLRESSDLLRELEASDGLVIVGAECQLESGEVHFLEESDGR